LGGAIGGGCCDVDDKENVWAMRGKECGKEVVRVCGSGRAFNGFRDNKRGAGRM